MPGTDLVLNPGKRAIKNISSAVAQQMDEYITNLKALQNALGTAAAIEGTVITHQVLDNVIEQGKILKEHGICCYSRFRHLRGI